LGYLILFFTHFNFYHLISGIIGGNHHTPAKVIIIVSIITAKDADEYPHP
jgi:hypothetical protein